VAVLTVCSHIGQRVPGDAGVGCSGSLRTRDHRPPVGAVPDPTLVPCVGQIHTPVTGGGNVGAAVGTTVISPVK